MMTAGALKVTACLALVFGSGAFCGVAVTVRRLRDTDARARAEERWVEQRRKDDARQLQLTPAESERLRPAYDRLLSDLRAVRETTVAGLGDAVRRQARDVADQLTPEQRQRWAQLLEQRRAQWERKAAP